MNKCSFEEIIPGKRDVLLFSVCKKLGFISHTRQSILIPVQFMFEVHKCIINHSEGMWSFQSSSSVYSIHLSCESMWGFPMVMLLSLQVGDFCSLFCNGLFQVVHSVALSWNLCVSFTLLSTKLCKDGMCSHFAFLTRAAILVALWPFTPLAPFAVNRCRISSRKIATF